jgi:alpha-D-xyloside xylohydrolase
MRLHGERQPFYQLEEEFRNGVRQFSSGQDNEVWSFGEENYEIMKSYMLLREQLRPYLRKIMMEAHEVGSPVMRTMFYEFPEESISWELTTQYMFGPDILVAPVMEFKQREREVYLPSGINWVELKSNKVYQGGQTILVAAPLSEIPIFIRETAAIGDLMI